MVKRRDEWSIIKLAIFAQDPGYPERSSLRIDRNHILLFHRLWVEKLLVAVDHRCQQWTQLCLPASVISLVYSRLSCVYGKKSLRTQDTFYRFQAVIRSQSIKLTHLRSSGFRLTSWKQVAQYLRNNLSRAFPSFKPIASHGSHAITL